MGGGAAGRARQRAAAGRRPAADPARAGGHGDRHPPTGLRAGRRPGVGRRAVLRVGLPRRSLGLVDGSGTGGRAARRRAAVVAGTRLRGVRRRLRRSGGRAARGAPDVGARGPCRAVRAVRRRDRGHRDRPRGHGPRTAAGAAGRAADAGSPHRRPRGGGPRGLPRVPRAARRRARPRPRPAAARPRDADPAGRSRHRTGAAATDRVGCSRRRRHAVQPARAAHLLRRPGVGGRRGDGVARDDPAAHGHRTRWHGQDPTRARGRGRVVRRVRGRGVLRRPRAGDGSRPRRSHDRRDAGDPRGGLGTTGTPGPRRAPPTTGASCCCWTTSSRCWTQRPSSRSCWRRRPD